MHISEDSPEGHRIEEVIERQAVTPEEAVRIILRSHSMSVEEAGPEAAEMRRLRKASRRFIQSERPDDPEALIGCLAEQPEILESMMQFASERRRSFWE